MSYSQVGEDLQIAYLLGKSEDVRYIDVGCLWPVRHSNTYYFYERGGSGLCIDPNPTVAQEYEAERPRDVFVNCGIGAEAGTLSYVMHENPVFNTFSAKRAKAVRKRASKRPGRQVKEVLELPVKTLAQVIEETGFDGRLDLLSVDVEGLELDVLRGHPFDVLRPRLVVVEHLRGRAEPLEDAAVVQLMGELDYWVAGFTGHDLYLLDGAA